MTSRPVGKLRRALVALIGVATAAAVMTSSEPASSGVVVGTASAFGEEVTGPVSSGPLPNVVAPPDGSASAVGVNLPNVLRTGILNASASTGNAGTIAGFTKADASAAFVKAGNNLSPVLTADLVTSSCRADADGLRGSSGLTNLKVRLLGIYVLQSTTAAPNSVINVPGVAKIVLNEQFKTSDTITVNAVHVTLLASTPALEEDIILSQSRCTAPPAACRSSLWDHSSVPPGRSFNDGQPVELGVKLKAKVAVRICAVVFYKAAGVEGPVNVRLWSAAGPELGSGAATTTSAAAWVTVNLRTAVDVAAGTSVIASYNTPGPYWAVSGAPTAESAEIMATGSAYRYGGAGTYPSTPGGANYFVDVVYAI